MNVDITLRPATKADIDLMSLLMEQTMRVYVEATWGAWDDTQVRGEMTTFASSGKAWIVQYNAIDSGLLVVDRAATHLQLEQLCIAPEMQRRGIGAILIRGLQQEARDRQVPLRLRVLRVNPAHRLYQRLGFTVTQTTTERLFMEWLPATAA